MKSFKIALIALIIFVLFSSIKSEQNIVKNKFKPTNDFSFLPKVFFNTACFNQDQWEKNSDAKFDSRGIVMYKNTYHPVNLFQYAFYNFDMYRKTQNEEYKKKFLDQIKYLNDTTLIKTFPDGGIGFPYDISWRDLKPKWYSGLAQAEGIMLLIRYYYLTNDKSSLDKIAAALKFMLKPQTDGGTLNQINDSMIWIEEYPNSKSKPLVINGFATAIMGLNEYCHLFPDDKETKKVLDLSLKTHKARAYMYDKGNGILYDQGEKQQVGAFYIKFQVLQMEEMYRIFKDQFYRNMQYLYAYYAYDMKITNTPACLLNDTNFTSPGLKSGNLINSHGALAEIFNSNLVLSSKTSQGVPNLVNLKNIYDGNTKSVFVLKNSDSLTQPIFIDVTLKENLKANRIRLLFNSEVSDFENISFKYRSQTNDSWKNIKIYNSKKISLKEYIVNFDELDLQDIKIVFNDSTKSKVFQICELNIHNTNFVKRTLLTHFLSDTLSIPSGKFKIDFEMKDISDYVIFYKLALDNTELAKQTTWNYSQVLNDKSLIINSKENKICKVLIVFRNKTSNAYLKNLKLTGI